MLIVALFDLLWRHILTLIDRRFYLHKHDAGKIVAAFTTTLRTGVGLTDLREHLINNVQAPFESTVQSTGVTFVSPDMLEARQVAPQYF